MSEKKLSDVIIPEDVFIDDDEVKIAIDNMLKGRVLEKEAKQLIDEAKTILDKKLHSKHILRSHTNALNVVISEYNEKVFEKDRLKAYDESIYNMCLSDKKRRRYLITPRINK